MRFDPARLPRPVRLAAYGLATAILLYLCLAPAKDIPKEPLWDKAEHAIAWGVLALSGLLLARRRPRAIVAFALTVGAAVEVLQATMGFGRDGDWRDLVADAVGVAAAAALWLAARRLLRRGGR